MARPLLYDGSGNAETCPSLATSAVQEYAKGLLYRFMKRYLAAINDGTILSVGFGTEANAEGQMPYQIKNADGSDDGGARPRGDFNPAAITRFKQIFPQHAGADNNAIANAGLNTPLGQHFWWHEADMLRNIEWIALDFAKAQLGSALTRNRFWSVDAGSYADGLSDTRRTYNIQARSARTEYLLIKTNDDPLNPHAIDYARSAAARISGIPYYEPSPAPTGPMNPFVEYRTRAATATARAKDEGFSLSLLVTSNNDITYNIALDANAIGLSNPVVPTSVADKTLNLSDIIAGGSSYVGNQWSTVRNATGKEYVNFTIVDDVQPSAPNCPVPLVSASPATVSPNATSTLSVSNCPGTVNWNTPSGTSSVNPSVTTTYTATCTTNGCTSPTGSVTVYVDGGCGSGSGLTTTYYNNQDLQGSPAANFSGNIDIIGEQSNNLPGSGVGALNVSARWEGQVEAPVNGTYNFNVQTDDGVRVWFNGQQVVDDFGIYGSTPHYFSANLSAGQKYNIKVEWKQGGGGFEARMYWNYPGQGNQIVPACRLYPTGCTAPNPPTLTATPSGPVSSGTSVILQYSGCVGGTVNWSTGAVNGFPTVNPTSTTTYTATCTMNGCTSGNGEVTVPVDGGTCAVANCNSVEGFFDGANCNDLGGWAYDPNQPNTPICVDVYEGNTLILANQPAGTYRPDLQNAGKGNGQHSFNISTPTTLKNGQNRSISIRVSGCSFTLSNSPKSINCQGSGCSNPPGAPVASASTTTINSGNPVYLSTTGCGGSVTWENSSGMGNHNAYPTSTTTYRATCTVNGCPSVQSNAVTVTVTGTPPPPNCINLSDLCSGNQYEIRSYNFSLSSGGNKSLTLTYRSHSEPGTGRIRINNGTWQEFSLPQTPGDLSYLTTGIGTYGFNSGNNTVDFASVNGGYVCFRELCTSSSGTRLGVPEEPAIEQAKLIVSPNPNDGVFEARFYVEPGRKATLRVSDVQGRQVWQKSLTGQGEHREQVRLPAQSVGTFVLLLDKEATGSKGKVEFKRVIVVR